MAFFRNRGINLLNLHFGIHALATGGGGAFFVVYLLKAGVSAPLALVSVALILIGRFIVRPAIVGLGVRWGLRRLLVVATLMSALQYPLLAEVDGVGAGLATLVAVTAIADMAYWTCYHAYYAALGDDEHRGKQLGVREAITAFVGVTAPLVAGWMLTAYGPRIAFGMTAAIAALSALPLLYTADVPVVRAAPGIVKTAAGAILLFAADGWLTVGYAIVWQIALFRALGESFLAYGGALALAALAGAIGGPLLGRHIDKGHGRRAVIYAIGTMATIIALRSMATGDAALAVTANAVGALGACLYIPVLMTSVYNQAKRSACPLRFHVATEAGWDAGGASGLLFSALILSLGAPIWLAVLSSLLGVAAAFVILNRYYTDLVADPAAD